MVRSSWIKNNSMPFVIWNIHLVCMETKRAGAAVLSCSDLTLQLQNAMWTILVQVTSGFNGSQGLRKPNASRSRSWRSVTWAVCNGQTGPNTFRLPSMWINGSLYDKERSTETLDVWERSAVDTQSDISSVGAEDFSKSRQVKSLAISLTFYQYGWGTPFISVVRTLRCRLHLNLWEWYPRYHARTR